MLEKIKAVLDGITARLGGDRSLENVGRSADIFLAFILICIISMLIVPIPPELLDLLIAANLSCSIALLMIALYIPSAVHLSIFPSLLLLTTLYRLAVNISSTRQILLHANA